LKLARQSFSLEKISGVLKIGFMNSTPSNQQPNPAKMHVAFYFEQLESGNLVGEYVNVDMTERGTESADIVPESRLNPHVPLVGKYKSSWWDGDADGSLLEIKKHHTGFEIFELTWTNNNTTIFEGIGMLCGDMLVGEYHKP
jgi:hypothetical protein